MKAIVIAAVLFILAFSLGLLLEQQTLNTEEPGHIYQSPCDLTQQTCEVSDGFFSYRVSFEGEPSPLKPFRVIVEPVRELSDMPVISFEMKGMDMGYNQFPLKAVESASTRRYEAQVILPVCSLGRNDWTMLLRLKGNEEQHNAEFQFSQEN